jgi:hypothetical protein
MLKTLIDIKFEMNIVVLEVAPTSKFWNMTLNSLVGKCTCIFFGLITGKPLKQILMYNESFFIDHWQTTVLIIVFIDSEQSYTRLKQLIKEL